MFNLLTGSSYLTYRFNLFRGGGGFHRLLQLHSGVAQQLLDLEVRDARHKVQGLSEELLQAFVEFLVLFS